MDVLDAIKKRRSVREYKDKPIPKEALESIVDAARFAPTARNVQPWEFVVITERTTLKKIAELAENGRFISGAAACIAVFCSETKYYLEDGCAATQNILIAATALGIASCWVAGDKKPYVPLIGSLLKAPASLKLVSLISLGYPKSKDNFKVAEKRGLGTLLHWEGF
ncbi:MAG: nitroreductase family protein [Candidatus Omnitrophica bacterium]|nr:nitroreductase family protein [Candidatus Omnitrophota bacterium]MDD5237857.1 nitroreductase family protein [Candidatus Omnitrophota bacterium]